MRLSLRSIATYSAFLTVGKLASCHQVDRPLKSEFLSTAAFELSAVTMAHLAELLLNSIWCQEGSSRNPALENPPRQARNDKADESFQIRLFESLSLSRKAQFQLSEECARWGG